MTTTQPSRPSSKRQRKPSQGEKQRRPAKTEYYHLRAKRRLKRHGQQLDRIHKWKIQQDYTVKAMWRNVVWIQGQLRRKEPERKLADGPWLGGWFFKTFVTLAILYLFLEPFLFRLI